MKYRYTLLKILSLENISNKKKTIWIFNTQIKHKTTYERKCLRLLRVNYNAAKVVRQHVVFSRNILSRYKHITGEPMPNA